MPEKINLSANVGSGKREWFFHLGLLLLFATLLRVISCYNAPVVNSDGIAYLLQAKAFYLQLSEQYFTSYPYPTNLALMIYGIYHFVADWVVAGQLISLFFSLLTIIPFYFLNRVFWSHKTAIAIVFLYVVSPVFVELGHEIIRGPQFWFFMVLGLWGFCCFLEREKPSSYLLVISSTAFFLAAWSRIEGLLPLFLSAAWLLFDVRCRKGRYLATYFFPFLLILIFSGGVILSCHNSLSINLFEVLFRGFSERLLASVNRFQELRIALLNLESSPPAGVGPYFFDEAHNLLWFLALGVAGQSLIKTFGILFFPFTIFGLTKERVFFLKIGSTKRRSFIFLVFLILSGAVLIYIQILLNWCSSERFVALIYFPTLIFSGYGFNKLFSVWKNKRYNSNRVNYIGVCLVIIVFTIPSILNSGGGSRTLPFKKIGLILAKMNPGNQEIRLCSTSKKVLFTHFYAHLDKPLVSSPWQRCTILNVNELDSTILEANYDYLLFFDRDGGRRKFLDIVKKTGNDEVVVILEKRTKRYGLLTLFSLRVPAKDGCSVVY